MRYELFLNRRPGERLDVPAVEAGLAGCDWGQAKGVLQINVVAEGGEPVTVSVSVPMGADTGLAEALLKAATPIAQQLNLSVFDPQLGREVGLGDVHDVEARYAEMARYAGEMLGLPEAIPAAFPEERGGLTLPVKIALGIIGVAVLAWWILGALLKLR